MFHAPGRTVRAALATAASVVMVATVGACSGDDTDEPASGGESPTEEAAPAIPTKAAIGKVAGKLSKKRRDQLKQRVTKTVDRWIDAAYVEGDYPRSDFKDAFAVFSKDAAALAERDARLMSNKSVGDKVEAVSASQRRLRIDVLADRGTAAGVTARFVLVLKLDGEVRRTDRIAGSLYLTYTKNEWKVFGYDVKRGRVA